jgi:hypothetical protein
VAELIFGLDFGTTNSLASYVDPVEGRLVNLVNLSDHRPHPSVVWYRGDSIVVGREARKWLDAGDEVVSGSFVRSPKRLLHAGGTVFVEGREVDPVDLVSRVLAFLKRDAADPERKHALPLERAVFTIPVELDGEGRARLREAARKAGIGVVQFVHEPLAALYGYLRAQENHRQLVTELEGQRLLVFDWGGGTLDLTLCLVSGGRLLQMSSRGNNDVGGDRFDELIRNWVLNAHAIEHGLDDFGGREAENAPAQLVNACERAKIELSGKERAPVFVRGYLGTDPGRDLALYITRSDLERITETLVAAGLLEIDRLLESVGLEHQDVALCLPTGGMVNMPAIRNGLLQKFGTRAKKVENGDRIISAGAAWIAHDGLRLSLAKPIELLQSDGTYISVVESGFRLPLENETISISQRMFFCADPRDGIAHFQFARPRRLGLGSRKGDRLPYLTAQLKVDPFARPLLERLEANISVDHDYVVTIRLSSKERRDIVETKIFDLEFALEVSTPGASPTAASNEASGGSSGTTGRPNTSGPIARGQIVLRSNVVGSETAWHLVPGDALEALKPAYFTHGINKPTREQLWERLYYHPCSECGKGSFEAQWSGCTRGCKGVPTPEEASRRRIENGYDA